VDAADLVLALGEPDLEQPAMCSISGDCEGFCSAADAYCVSPLG